MQSNEIFNKVRKLNDPSIGNKIDNDNNSSGNSSKLFGDSCGSGIKKRMYTTN